MKPLPLVHASYVVELDVWLRRHGVDTEPLWEQSGLPRRALERDADRFVNVRQVFAFAALAQQLLDSPDLGCRIAAEVDLVRLPAFAGALAAGRSLSEVLALLVEELRADTNRMPIWLRPRADAAWISFGQSVPRGTPGEAFVEQHDLTLFVRLIRHLTLPSWQPAWLQLSRCTGAESAAVAARFPDAEIRQGLFTAVPVEAALLGAAVSDAQRPRRSVRRRQPAPEDFVASLRALLHATLDLSGSMRIGTTARVLGVSVRTLQRRLAQAGTSYSGLLDTLRQEVAVDLIRHTDTPLSAIAGDLGYSHPAHFTRAFRRWTDSTPRSYRRTRAQ